MTERGRRIWLTLTLFAVAAAARIAYVVSVWQHPAVRYPVLDCLAYHDWALAILHGDWLGQRVYYQDPLYPFFLAGLYAVFGPDTLGVLIAQALLGAASAVLIAWLARRVGGEAVGWVAGVLAAFYPVFFFFDALLMKGTLKVFVFSAALLLAVRAVSGASAWRWLAAGFALGIGCLLRPNALLFAPVLCAFAWRAPRARGLATALCALGLLAAVAPVSLRNALVGGDWVLLNSQGGQNFYIGNFRANHSGTFVAPPFLRADPRFEEADFRREAEREVGRSLRPSEVSRYWMRRGLAEIAADPRHFLRHTARKLLVFVNDHEVADNESYDFFAQHVSPLLAWPLPGWGALLPLALCGFGFAWRERPAALLIAFFITYAAGLLPFFVLSRLRLPLAPVVIAFAALALVRVAEHWRRGDRNAVLRALAFVAVTALVTHLPVVHDDATASHFNLAQAHRMQAKLARERASSLAARGDGPAALAALAELDAQQRAAEAQLFAGLELEPENPRLRTALHNLRTTRIVELLRLERAADALPIAHALVEASPERADAHARLGDVLARLGRRGEAEQAYRRALALDPEHARARRGLARVQTAGAS